MSRIKRWWRKLCGYSDCPLCDQQTVKWVKDYIYHPEEPPMVGHWQCTNPECLARTEVEGTAWADKIAREMGHRSFRDAVEKAASHLASNGNSANQ